MLVVVDTTPINYLVLIDHVLLLASLYEQVIIPRAVAAELPAPESPRRRASLGGQPAALVYDSSGPRATGPRFDAAGSW